MIGPHMLRKGGGGKGRGQDRKTIHFYSGRPRERIRFCECEMVQNSRNGVTLVFIGISEHRMTSGNKVREWEKNLQIVRTFGFNNNNKTHSGNTKRTHRQQQRHCYIVGVTCTCQPGGTGPKSTMIATLNMPSRLRRMSYATKDTIRSMMSSRSEMLPLFLL